jgi:hypothetical protein
MNRHKFCMKHTAQKASNNKVQKAFPVYKGCIRNDHGSETTNTRMLVSRTCCLDRMSLLFCYVIAALIMLVVTDILFR